MDTVKVSMDQDLIWGGVIYRKGKNVELPMQTALDSGRYTAPEEKIEEKAPEVKPAPAKRGRSRKKAATTA